MEQLSSQFTQRYSYVIQQEWILTPGDRVALQGLQRQASLNGVRGVIQPRDDKWTEDKVTVLIETEPPRVVVLAKDKMELVRAADANPDHPCPICFEREDSYGDPTFCFSCGQLQCGDCSTRRTVAAMATLNPDIIRDRIQVDCPTWYVALRCLFTT